MYVLQSGKFIPLRSNIKTSLCELTFALLRYFLGGDRPSQTTPHPLSLNKLDINHKIKAISLTPPQLTGVKGS